MLGLFCATWRVYEEPARERDEAGHKKYKVDILLRLQVVNREEKSKEKEIYCWSGKMMFFTISCVPFSSALAFHHRAESLSVRIVGKGHKIRGWATWLVVAIGRMLVNYHKLLKKQSQSEIKPCKINRERVYYSVVTVTSRFSFYLQLLRKGFECRWSSSGEITNLTVDYSLILLPIFERLQRRFDCAVAIR